MKTTITKIISGLALVTSLTSCEGQYVQLVYTDPISKDIKKNEEKFYIYENDDVRLVYSFWNNHGIMSFMIYNKSDAPLYIDWAKSAFINESKRTSYYQDKTTTNFSAVGGSSTSGWLSVFGNYASGTQFTSGWLRGNETVVKEERTTFLPPRSYVFKPFFNLSKYLAYDINNRSTKEVKYNGVKMFVTTVKSGNQIKFRNYLTYSASEDFKQSKAVDNEFSIRKIVTMKTDDFGYKDYDGTPRSNWESPDRFYLDDLDEKDLYAD